MLVKTQCIGSEVTGLHVGANNVRRYFPRSVSVIELQLDDLQIACGLGPEFWKDRPEIRDPRLCEWLAFKIYRRQKGRKPLDLAMTPSGESTFRLGETSPEERSAPKEGAGSLI